MQNQHNEPVLGFFLLLGLVILSLWGFHRVCNHVQRERRIRALQITQVDSMSGWEFERYVARLLQHRGHKTEITKRSGDFGVDILTRKGKFRFAVQCKRQAKNVSRRAVSDVVAGRVHYKCDASIVVTNSWFSPGARTLAKSTDCELIDRAELTNWIMAFQRRAPAEAVSTPPPDATLPQEKRNAVIERT
jgi:restriction system protein